MNKTAKWKRKLEQLCNNWLGEFSRLNIIIFPLYPQIACLIFSISLPNRCQKLWDFFELFLLWTFFSLSLLSFYFYRAARGAVAALTQEIYVHQRKKSVNIYEPFDTIKGENSTRRKKYGFPS